jgi:hypothetical protein
MSLKQWAENGWLKQHKTTRQEIGNLLKIVDRDLLDAAGGISSDWRLGIAYNAALKLATILLAAEGYRADRASQHYRTIQSIPLILGEQYRSDADYLDTCRTKRNTIEYDSIGAATNEDSEELSDFVKDFRVVVMDWLRKHHPELIDKEVDKH